MASYKIPEYLTREQKEILANLLLDNVYVTNILGSAGTGKTQLIREYCNLCQMKVQVCSYTGVAAALHTGGKTLHKLLTEMPKDISKALKIKEFREFLTAQKLDWILNVRHLSEKQHNLSCFKYQDYLETIDDDDEDSFYKALEMTCIKQKHNYVLVIDESSMVPRRMLEMMLKLFKFEKIILVGDKYQIAPVVTNEKNKGYCYGVLPPDTVHYEINEVVRQKDAAMLTALRDLVKGIDQTKNLNFLNRYFTDNYSPFKREDVRIYYTNAEKDQANREWLQNSKSVKFHPDISIIGNLEEMVDKVPFLKGVDPNETAVRKAIREHYRSTFARFTVEVPESGTVMCLKNQTVRNVLLANGHLCDLKNAKGGHPMPRQKENVFGQSKIEWEYNDVLHYKGKTFPVLANTRPFHKATADYFSLIYPALQPAYAFTYHKTQGMTITAPKTIGIYVPKFALDLSGLMYVALTRCTDFKQINLHGSLKSDHFKYRFDLDVDRMVDNSIAVAENLAG